jgi:TonB-dependent starch-binding outer membrane protein SusC
MKKLVVSHDDIKLSHQFLRKMKLTVLLLITTVLSCFSAETYSQITKLNVVENNSTLLNVIRTIESQSEFNFFYNEKVDIDRTVSVDMTDKTVSEILDKVLENSSVKYKIIGRQIALYNKNEMEPFLPKDDQSGNISGKVTDKSGAPLPGVSISVKGTTTGTTSDINGNFSLVLPSDAKILTFSFIGMSPLELEIGSQKVFNITMVEAAIGLEEVVVIGYGTQRKATLTGSVASVATKELIASPSLNVTDAMSGLMPGVITKMYSGEPGRDTPSILIRGLSTTGDNSPLIVVDGIQGVSGWERINPNDIESISVLKDASAVIYGSRAANGVILITTKRGSLGKPTISYSFNQAINQPTRIPKMANSAQFAEYVNQLDVEAGQPPRYSDEELQKFADGTDPNYISEDWYGRVLKKSSFQSQHNLNVRGGSENIKYSISGSYTNQGSIFENGSLKYNTYSLRSNVDAQINKNLKVGFDLNSSLENGDYPAYSTNTTFDRLKQVPFEPVYWSNGLPSAGIENGENPAIMASSQTGNENIKTHRYIAKGSFDLTIPWVKGLGIDGYLAYSNYNTLDKNWQTPWTVYDYDQPNDTYIPITGGGILYPQLTESSADFTSTLVNVRIKYQVKLNDHNLSAFIAAEQSNDVSSNFNAFRKSFVSSTLDELFAGSLIDQSTDGGRSENGRQNLFGRLSYGFREKYLLDFNFRYDGSSNFPPGNRFGFFPGASVAWRISEENFMKNNVSFINRLKLRASIGKIGNDAIAPFQYLRLYSIENTGMGFGLPSAQTNGLVEGVSPNPYITWEVATTENIGVDASLWKDLFGFSIDIFKQKRSNILATRSLSIPFYTGLSLPAENIGVVENRGFEIEVNHSKSMGDFSWRVAGNVTYSHNNVVDISEAQNVPEWQKLQGHVLGATKYYHALGIFRTQEEVNTAPIFVGTQVGDLQYEDKNGDKEITAADMTTMDKTNIPQIVYGLNLSLNYKNFSFWANFAGAGNVWQYYHLNARIAMNQLEDIIVNRYTPGSMDSKYPRLPTLETEDSGEVDGLASDFWLKNASYVRLKTLELSYNVPTSWLSKVKIQSLRMFLNGQNLFTIDNLKWADPENTSTTASYYPQSKIYNLGINITF